MGESDIDSLVNEVLINILKIQNREPIEHSDYWTSVTKKGENPIFSREQLSVCDIKEVEEDAYTIRVSQSDMEIIDEDIYYFSNLTEEDIYSLKDLCYKLFSEYEDITLAKIYIDIIICISVEYKILVTTYKSHKKNYDDAKRINEKKSKEYQKENTVNSYEAIIDKLLLLVNSNMDINIEKDLPLKLELQKLRENIPNRLNKNEPLKPSAVDFADIILERFKNSHRVKDKEKSLINRLITKEKGELVRSYLGKLLKDNI